MQQDHHTVMRKIVSETWNFKCNFILFTNPIDIQ